MKTYYLTVYSKKGENLLDENFEAKDDQEAKDVGTKKLEEQDYQELTHRCVSPDGRLVLFRR
ncbi:YhzD family protein [Alkalibacillus haloalkaliphilus]|uniref:YhzD family protein n=1 Tax=Alkalibacillus haloalkaliphilus TaxID=94136 RepID=UPI002936C45E|nr:YhzD family protein [Alkalibacillus haloalkaliphilus]MDV2583419.1 YhzD family protein [Alkalibacillus haloalkaliphilus]